VLETITIAAKNLKKIHGINCNTPGPLWFQETHRPPDRLSSRRPVLTFAARELELKFRQSAPDVWHLINLHVAS
jgi:hypothetical protein